MTLNTVQFRAMQGEIDAHSQRSRAADNEGIRSPFYRNHDEHGANPAYRAAGWTNNHCGYDECPHFDEHMYDWGGPYDRAHEDPSPRHVLLDPRKAPLRAQESVVDVEHVQRLVRDPRNTRAKRPPRVLEADSGLHIIDGHHRLLASYLRGDKIPVDVSRG